GLGEDVLAGDLQPLDALEDVGPPGGVVGGVRHRLAVLAVADDRDAELALPAHEVGDRRGEQLLELGGPLQREAVLGERAGSVGGDELRGARQAAGVGDVDVGHGGPSGLSVSRTLTSAHASPVAARVTVRHTAVALYPMQTDAETRGTHSSL